VVEKVEAETVEEEVEDAAKSGMVREEGTGMGKAAVEEVEYEEAVAVERQEAE
jgi:hypothetical protein